MPKKEEVRCGTAPPLQGKVAAGFITMSFNIKKALLNLYGCVRPSEGDTAEGLNHHDR
jgi:hypothetical protein